MTDVISNGYTEHVFEFFLIMKELKDDAIIRAHYSEYFDWNEFIKDFVYLKSFNNLDLIKKGLKKGKFIIV
jgi:hypothetical protein